MNNNNDSIDVGILQDMYKNSELAEYIFDYLADRQRNYSETTPERLIQVLYQGNLTVNRVDAISFFRNLEEAGCGRYVAGRRGHSSRFVWYVKMSDVGQAAQGNKDTVDEIAKNDILIDEQDDENEETRTHEFVLRPDFSIRITLPLDLKTSEASRISEWVKTLPF